MAADEGRKALWPRSFGPLPEAEAPGKIGLTGFVGNFRTREHCNGVTQL